MKKNRYTNTRIEFHILQSFPVTCLNRDDVGSPKTAIVGGALRARVSSQCWKRYIRLAMNEMKNLGIVAGIRTKWLGRLIEEACRDRSASEEQAGKCGNAIQSIFIKEEKSPKSKRPKAEEDESQVDDTNETADGEKNDALIFLSPSEISRIADEFKNAGFDPGIVLGKDKKKWKGKVEDIISRKTVPMDALDIALFGRMVAQAAQLNVQAAASFSHAISTHKVSNEVEFFTALDDVPSDVPGSSHMGTLEFNSATYYRYISLDLGQLCETIGESQMSNAIEAFTKALFWAVPNARQSTMSGASLWDYAKVLIRKGQRLQLPFETPIKSKEGYLKPSIDELNKQLTVKEKLAGSLFGKIAEYTLGDSDYSIDDLASALRNHVDEAIRQ